MINLGATLTFTDDPPDAVISSILKVIAWDRFYGPELNGLTRDLAAREVFFACLINRGGIDSDIDWAIAQDLLQDEDRAVWERVKSTYAQVGITELEKNL